MSCSSSARPSGCLKSSVTLSLLRLMLRKYALSPSRNGGPQPRVSSPLPGCSTLMTRAPMSASSIVQYGPDNTRVKSRIVVPSSGGVIDVELYSVGPCPQRGLYCPDDEALRPTGG